MQAERTRAEQVPVVLTRAERMQVDLTRMEPPLNPLMAAEFSLPAWTSSDSAVARTAVERTRAEQMQAERTRAEQVPVELARAERMQVKLARAERMQVELARAQLTLALQRRAKLMEPPCRSLMPAECSLPVRMSPDSAVARMCRPMAARHLRAAQPQTEVTQAEHIRVELTAAPRRSLMVEEDSPPAAVRAESATAQGSRPEAGIRPPVLPVGTQPRSRKEDPAASSRALPGPG